MWSLSGMPLISLVAASNLRCTEGSRLVPRKVCQFEAPVIDLYLS